MDFKQAATELADKIVSVSGGPITSREDGIRFAEKYLREAYQRGWDGKQQQLADNMYSRRKT